MNTHMAPTLPPPSGWSSTSGPSRHRLPPRSVAGRRSRPFWSPCQFEYGIAVLATCPQHGPRRRRTRSRARAPSPRRRSGQPWMPRLWPRRNKGPREQVAAGATVYLTLIYESYDLGSRSARSSKAAIAGDSEHGGWDRLLAHAQGKGRELP